MKDGDLEHIVRPDFCFLLFFYKIIKFFGNFRTIIPLPTLSTDFKGDTFENKKFILPPEVHVHISYFGFSFTKITIRHDFLTSLFFVYNFSK